MEIIVGRGNLYVQHRKDDAATTSISLALRVIAKKNLVGLLFLVMASQE